MKPADTILALFREGKDTFAIANELGMSESGVYNSLHTAREADRARKRWQAKYYANTEYLKLRRCGYPREQALEIVGGWRTPTRSASPRLEPPFAAQLGANAPSLSDSALPSSP